MITKPTLFFLYIDGCEACAAMKPIVKRIAIGNPWLEVRAYDLLEADWKAPIEPPSSIPALALVLPKAKRPFTLVGAWDEAPLQKWLIRKAAENGWPVVDGMRAQ